MHKIRYIILLFMGTIQAAHTASLSLMETNPPLYKWCISLPLDKGDIFYAEYFDLASDNPDIIIDSWHVDQQANEAYDATFKQTKKIIDKPVTISVITTIQEMPANANFHLNYYRRSHNTISHEMLSIPHTSPPTAPAEPIKEEEKHYSLLKKEVMFYTPPPIPLAILWVLTLIMAYYYLRQRHNMRGIILIAFSVFLCFQLAKSLVINWKKPYNWGHTALSDRKPMRFTKSILNGGIK